MVHPRIVTLCQTHKKSPTALVVRQPPSGASVGLRSERTFAFRVRLLGRGRGPEQTPVSWRVLGPPTANPRPASPGACSGTQRRQAAASRSVSLARESGHLGGADSSTAGRRRG